MNYLVTSFVMLLELLKTYPTMPHQHTKYGLYAFPATYSDSLMLDNICDRSVNISTLDSNSIMIDCVFLDSTAFTK